MPLYEHDCLDCQTTFRQRRPFAAASAPIACPHCDGNQTRKRLNAVSVVGQSRSDSIPLSLSSSDDCACGRSCGCGH